MRKIIHVISSLVILAAGVSCVKEIPGQAGNDGNMEVGTQMRTVTFMLNVSSPTQTKAVGIAGLDEDTIHRIDVYEWDSNRYIYWDGKPKHYVLTSTEIQNGVFHAQNPTNAQKGYLFYANLSPQIAEKIADTAGRSLYDLKIRSCDWYTETNGIPMGGELFVQFDADKSVDLSLERFFFRIDVGEIKADFEDPSWFDRDIFVKNIALINVPNIMTPIGGYSSYFEQSNAGEYIFGDWATATENQPFFGGLEKVNVGNSWSYDTYYSCWNPNTGNSVNSVSFLMNRHDSYTSAGVMNIDATGVWATNTLHSYDIDNGEGRLCSSTNPSLSHVLTVNKSFYGMQGNLKYGIYGTLSSKDNQNYYTKLVVELSVDGTTYFYPIQVYRPQHNTAYRINRITLKSAGSEYANFFEIKIAAEVDISVEEWGTATINNVDLGYKDYSGSQIY